jgi:hypothetical protein
VHEVDLKPHQSALTGQPGESHVCPRNISRTCNCTGACADDDDGDTVGLAGGCASEQQRVDERLTGAERCAVSGQPCAGVECREWCEGSGTGAAANDDRCIAAAANDCGDIDTYSGTTK